MSELGFYPAPRESEGVSLSRSRSRSRSLALALSLSRSRSRSLALALWLSLCGKACVWVINVGRVTYPAEDALNTEVVVPGHVDTGAEPPRATGGCRSPERAGEELPSHDVAESDSGTEHND